MLGRIANCLIFKFRSEPGCVLRNRDPKLGGSEVAKSPASKTTNRKKGAEVTKPRPTHRELNFGADRADHCRQGMSRTLAAPARQHFRMQLVCRRCGPRVDRR